MWKNIIGHKSQIEQIVRTFEQGRLPNAYLFAGPHGIGKRLVASTFASLIACKGDDLRPCGACVACMKVAKNIHPDIFVIEPEKDSIKIDQIRELQGKLQLFPLEAPAKLAIIDGAEIMTESAANSLLKILEEPPQATHFILVTSSEHRLLPTIRSRCRTVRFLPLSNETIANHLERDGGVDGEMALQIANIASGSLGLAKKLDPEFIGALFDRFSALSNRPNCADILETAESWAKDDEERIPLILDILSSWYRDLLKFKVTGKGADGIGLKMLPLHDALSVDQVEAKLGNIEITRNSSSMNLNKQLMFEQLLLSLTMQ